MTHVLMMVRNTIDHDTRVLKSALAMADGGARVTLLGESRTKYREETRFGGVHIIRVPVDYALRNRRLRAVAKRHERRLAVGVGEDEARLLQLLTQQRVRERNDLGGRGRKARAALSLGRRRVTRWRNDLDARLETWESDLRESANTWWDNQTVGASWRRDLPEVDDLDLAFTPVIDQLDWDVLHCHDVHNMGTCARAVARRRAAGRPAMWVYDAHEYVAGLPIYPPRTKRLIAAWTDLEQEFVRDADAVITVTAPLAEELRRSYALPTTPTVVMNAPVFSEHVDLTAPGIRQDCGLADDVPLVVYSGGVTRARGIHTVVEALPSMPGVHLAVVCVPHAEVAPAKELAELAESLGVRDRLHLLDPVAPEQVSTYLASADVGVHPMVHFGSHEFALPNKLFEYLHAGLPLVVSDCRALARFVKENDLGAVFTAEDATGCAAALTDVLARRDAVHRRIVSDDALLEPYSWNHQAASLRGLYRTLLGADAVPVEPEAETSLRDVDETPAWREDRPSLLAIGPTGSAGQAWAWAKSVERHVPGADTFVLSIDRGGPYQYSCDESVSFARFTDSSTWAKQTYARAIAEWTHVLLETGRPMFGSLHGPDFVEDARILRGRGIRVGLVFHGSEIRSPELHAQRSRWSPFHESHDGFTDRLQRHQRRLRNRVETFMEEESGPVFVSTPDLLFDLPDGAIWLPPVVDLATWEAEPTTFDRERPVVLHAPSLSVLKGSVHADAVAQRLHDEGLIEYRRIEKVPPAQMPERIKDADILLDQFVIGMHGAISVEAMAAGRIAVAHIDDDVRPSLPGCPVVEANPDTLEDVLRRLVADREDGRRAARAGQEYVLEVHEGLRSAAVLAEHLHLRG